MSGWLMERYGTEGYVLHRMGHPAQITILPADFIDAEEWGENALGLDIAVKQTAECLLAALQQRALREERYWCGCVRHSRWERCADHGELDYDEEPPGQQRAQQPVAWMVEQQQRATGGGLSDSWLPRYVSYERVHCEKRVADPHYAATPTRVVPLYREVP